MFKRKHHIQIASILQALNSELLAEHHCLFGGGTAIVLSNGEYRESIDIDFIVSDRSGYQVLRHLITGPNGILSIVRSGANLSVAREIRADQYGIRTMLLVADTEIKFEIIFEGRIQLESHLIKDNICGVSTLTSLDMMACKLLANSDRWSDDSVFSRDLIDLAMINQSQLLITPAINKAAGAYGDSIERDLTRAIQSLEKRKGRLEECMSALKIDHTPRALLWQRIRKLKPSLR